MHTDNQLSIRFPQSQYLPAHEGQTDCAQPNIPSQPQTISSDSITRYSCTTSEDTKIPDVDPLFIKELWAAVLYDTNDTKLPTSLVQAFTAASLMEDPHAHGVPASWSSTGHSVYHILFNEHRPTEINRFNRYTKQFPKLHVWLDPAKVDTLFQTLKEALDRAPWTLELFSAFTTTIFLAPKEAHTSLTDSKIARAMGSSIHLATARSSVNCVLKSNSEQYFIPPRNFDSVQAPAKHNPSQVSRSTVSKIPRPTGWGVFTSSERTTPEQEIASGKETSSIPIKLSCAYFAVKLWNSEKDVSQIIPTTNVRGEACPYLTIEFEGDETDGAYQRLNISATIFVYNRWRLVLLAHASAKVAPDQALELDAALNHWSIKITRVGWEIYLTEPGSKVQTGGTNLDDSWKRCTIKRISSGNFLDADGLSTLMAAINDIHYWALTKYVPACNAAIEALARGWDSD